MKTLVVLVSLVWIHPGLVWVECRIHPFIVNSSATVLPKAYRGPDCVFRPRNKALEHSLSLRSSSFRRGQLRPAERTKWCLFSTCFAGYPHRTQKDQISADGRLQVVELAPYNNPNAESPYQRYQPPPNFASVIDIVRTGRHHPLLGDNPEGNERYNRN